MLSIKVIIRRMIMMMLRFAFWRLILQFVNIFFLQCACLFVYAKSVVKCGALSAGNAENLLPDNFARGIKKRDPHDKGAEGPRATNPC